MFAAMFRILSDSEVAVLRLDLLDQGAVARFELTDATGQVHHWEHDMRWDEGSTTYQDRAWAAMVSYLVDARDRGWVGRLELVQSATGIPPSYWLHEIRRYVEYMSFHSLAPDRPVGVVLQ